MIYIYIYIYIYEEVSVGVAPFFSRKVFTSCWANGFQICWS